MGEGDPVEEEEDGRRSILKYTEGERAPSMLVKPQGIMLLIFS